MSKKKTTETNGQPRAKSGASIFDVAARAGVSIATVSRVINGRNRVAPETIRKVEAAMHALQFRPNRQARALTLRKTDTIGLVLPDLYGEFYGELMRGVDQAAREAGVHVLITRAVSPEEERATVEELLQGGAVDGLIFLVSQFEDNALSDLARFQDSLLILDRDVGNIELDNVLVDNRDAGREATLHLIRDAGAESLAFIGGPEGNVDTDNRLAGFRDACHELGIDSSPEHIHYSDYSYEMGLAIGESYSSLIEDDGGRWGFIAANDNLARGVMEALVTKGAAIPHDAAIIGFDDTELARVVRPRLTSMRVPLQEIGRTCVRLLVDRLRGLRTEPAKMVFKARLAQRASTTIDSDPLQNTQENENASSSQEQN